MTRQQLPSTGAVDDAGLQDAGGDALQRGQEEERPVRHTLPRNDHDDGPQRLIRRGEKWLFRQPQWFNMPLIRPALGSTISPQTTTVTLIETATGSR